MQLAIVMRKKVFVILVTMGAISQLCIYNVYHNYAKRDSH